VSAPSRDLARASALSSCQWRLLIEAFAWLGLLRLVTSALPYRRVASLLRLTQSDAAQAEVTSLAAVGVRDVTGPGNAEHGGRAAAGVREVTGRGNAEHGGRAVAGRGVAGGREAEAIVWAVSAAAARTPWRSTCLVRSLAGCAMLRRHGVPSVVYLGVAKDASGRLVAHSWLRCGGRVVTGGGSQQGYAAIAAYRPVTGARG
jgi:Transglutaminase-like superfamily